MFRLESSSTSSVRLCFFLVHKCDRWLSERLNAFALFGPKVTTKSKVKCISPRPIDIVILWFVLFRSVLPVAFFNYLRLLATYAGILLYTPFASFHTATQKTNAHTKQRFNRTTNNVQLRFPEKPRRDHVAPFLRKWARARAHKRVYTRSFNISSNWSIAVDCFTWNAMSN